MILINNNNIFNNFKVIYKKVTKKTKIKNNFHNKNKYNKMKQLQKTTKKISKAFTKIQKTKIKKNPNL